jgi:hypothetical protein
MATTTNYGWTTPDDTALVKDGAAAIRTLGTSVDTTTKNLNPATTLGDIQYRSSTSNVNTRLGIGSTGNVLTVAGGVPTWSAPSAAGFSGALIYGSSAQGIPNNATTVVTFDSEAYDIGGYHDNVTNNERITVPTGKDGYFFVFAKINWNNAASGRRLMEIYKNNSTIITQLEFLPASSIDVVGFVGVAINAVATDYFSLKVYQTSGGTLNANKGVAYSTHLGAYYLGA